MSEIIDGEEWRDVVGEWGDLYEVSNQARVRRKGREWVLKASANWQGYRKVIFSRMPGGGKQLFSVHRLVAMAFIPNPEGLPCIDHVNNVRHDNRLENLQWVTAEENIRRAHAGGRLNATKARGEASGAAKMREEQVREIRRRRANGERGLSLAREFGLSGSTVNQICERKTWRHVAEEEMATAPFTKPMRRRRFDVRRWAGKLNEEQVKAIRARYLADIPAQDLAVEYGLSKEAIMNIVRRISWRHI